MSKYQILPDCSIPELQQEQAWRDWFDRLGVDIFDVVCGPPIIVDEEARTVTATFFVKDADGSLFFVGEDEGFRKEQRTVQVDDPIPHCPEGYPVEELTD